MSKPQASFLSLPRELRQQIISDTFDNIHTNNQGGYYNVTVSDLMRWADNDVQYETIGGYVNFLESVLGIVRVVRQDLEEVHEELKEDVDYVIGKKPWIAFLEEFEKAQVESS